MHPADCQKLRFAIATLRFWQHLMQVVELNRFAAAFDRRTMEVIIGEGGNSKSWLYKEDVYFDRGIQPVFVSYSNAWRFAMVLTNRFLYNPHRA